MAQYSVLSGESVYDIAVKLYGDAPLGIQDLLTQNVIDLDDTELFGTVLTYTEGLSRQKPVFPVITVTRPQAPYTIRYLQSHYDLAIQLYGDISKIGNILNYFPNLDTDIPQGSQIEVPEQDDPIAVYFKEKSIIVATVPVPPPPVPPFAFDPDYQGVLDYADSQGYTLPSAAQQLKQNQLVLDLKAAGIWTELDILYVFATDGDSDYAKINWINPGTFTQTQVGTVTFTMSIGFSGNAVNGYFNNGWVPSTHAIKYTQNDACVFTYIANEVLSSGKIDFGANSGIADPSTQLNSRDASNQHRVRINTSTAVSRGTGVTSQGFYQLQRTASNVSKIFKDGVQVGVDITSISAGLPNRFIPSFANNNNGTIGGFSDRQQGIYGAGSSLSGNESAFNTIWDDYFTSL